MKLFDVEIFDYVENMSGMLWFEKVISRIVISMIQNSVIIRMFFNIRSDIIDFIFDYDLIIVFFVVFCDFIFVVIFWF